MEQLLADLLLVVPLALILAAVVVVENGQPVMAEMVDLVLL